MRRFTPFLIVSFLLPLFAYAIDYTDQSVNYEDAPFSRAESVAISVLTNADVVGGYPDGTFHPERTLNRAEFLKIAWLSVMEEPAMGEPAKNCFPDIRASDWFSSFVCESKNTGVVQGYPDGYFHPERPVNYAEAVKMLVELYGYELPEPPENERWTWYRPYYLAAEEHKVLLAVNIEIDAALTRGQMARLAAAFMAESEGDLETFRRMESGQTSRSSSPKSSSSSSVSSSISSSSSSSSVSSSSVLDVPLRSHFLVTGEVSAPIASGKFFSTLEPMTLRGAEVVLNAEIPSILAMYLIDASGNRLGQLTLDIFDSTDKTWKGTFSDSTFKIPQKMETTLAIQVLLKDRGAGGESEDLVKVDEFSITVLGEYSSSTYESQPREAIVYPQHQTAFGRITRVINTMSTQEAFTPGTNQLLGSFLFEGSVVAGATLAIETLEFDISKATGVAVSNWTLRSTDNAVSHVCSVSSSTVSCTALSSELGTLNNGARTLKLYGDVSLDQGSGDPFLQVGLTQPGTVGTNGSIRWTDGTGHFTWVELDQPVARGTRWE